MSARQLIDQGITFSDQLHMHHSIEEQMVFPMLGRRMPEFQGDLQGQHKLIHKGLDGFVAYLRECRRGGDKELDLAVLKEKMEGWGGVLWEHLDDEVKALGAENMRKYWTLDEVRKMPM
jgi:hemerythrin-like domain-containing protein